MVERSRLSKDSNVDLFELVEPRPGNWKANVIWTNLVPNTRYQVSNIAGFDRYDRLNPGNTVYNPYIFRSIAYSSGKQFNTGDDEVLLLVARELTRFKIRNGITAQMAMIFPSLDSGITFTTNKVVDKRYRLNIHVESDTYQLNMNSLTYDTDSDRFDTTSLENRIINTTRYFFNNYKIEFSYFNVTDNVDVLDGTDEGRFGNTAVVKKTNPFNNLNNTISHLETKLHLPTRMVKRSVTHNRIKLAIKHPAFSETYWDNIFTDKANVQTSGIFECNIGMNDTNIYDSNIFLGQSNFETAYDFTYTRLLPNNTYDFKFVTFKNYNNLNNRNEILKFDHTKYPKQVQVHPYESSDYESSDYEETTSSDNVNIVVGTASKELLDDQGLTRLVLPNINFQTDSIDLVYDVLFVVKGDLTDYISLKKDLKFNNDFTLTFEPEDFDPPLFYFDKGNVHVSFVYSNVNWDSLNGYILPSAVETFTAKVTDGRNVLDINALELFSEAFLPTIDVSKILFLIKAADRVDFSVPGISRDFVSHRNLTNLYTLEANVVNTTHHYLINIPIEAGMNISDNIIYELNNLLPNSTYVIDLLSFTHLRSLHNPSAVSRFFQPFIPKSGTINTPTDNVSVSFSLIIPIVLDNNGNAGFVFENVVFNTNASTQNYQVNILFEEISENNLTGNILTVNVSKGNIADTIQPTGLSFGKYRLTHTYTNTTYGVPVTVSNGGANVSQTYFSKLYDLEPFPLPTIEMSNVANAPDRIIVNFRYTHPAGGMSNVYDMVFESAFGGFDIDQTFQPKVFTGLVPNTLYGVRMTSFSHNSGVSSIEFDSNFPAANIHTTSDNVSFVYENVQTTLGNDDGDMNVVLRGFSFTKTGAKSYDVLANITDLTNITTNTRNITDIHAYVSDTINLNSELGYRFDYFKAYKITLAYKNTTDGVDVLDGPSGNVIYDPIDIGTRLPLNVPTFGVARSQATSITCTFQTYNPNIVLNSDKYRYVVKAVAPRDHTTAANVEDTLAATDFGGLTFQFTDLFPSRTYTISYDKFQHLKVDNSVSGIVIADFRNETKTQTTTFDTFVLENPANIEFILLNDRKETRIIIKDLEITGKLLENAKYRARITVTGTVNGTADANSEDFDIGNSSHAFSIVDFDYFASKNVVLDFYYTNSTVAVLDGLDGDIVSQTFDTHTGRSLEPPIVTLTRGEYMDIVANLDFTIPVDLVNSITGDFVVYLRFSEYSSTWVQKANVEITIGPGEYKQHLFDNTQALIIKPDVLYKAEISSFVHNVVNSLIPLSDATNEVTIYGLTDNIVLNLTGVSSDEIDVSGNVNVKLTNYTLVKNAVDFASYDYDIYFTFMPDAGLPNINHVVDEGNLSNIGIVPGLNAHTTYDVYVRYKKQDEDVFVSNPGSGGEKVTTYSGVKLVGPDSFDAPRGLTSTDVGVTSANLQFTEFPMYTISNNYTWKLQYDEVTVGPFGGNWDAVYPFENLIPNKTYTLSLVEFGHAEDPGGNIVFGSFTANTELDTGSDNVHGTIDVANVSRNLMNDNGDIGVLILPGFVFETDITNDYLVNINFKQLVTGLSVFSDTVFINMGLAELRFVNPIGLSYFTGYTVDLTYRNYTHGNIHVTNISRQSITNSFTLPGAPPLESPQLEVSEIGPDFIIIKFASDIHPEISDNFTASFRVETPVETAKNYPFEYIRWGGEFSLPNLESSTRYDIYLETWDHVGGVLFETPTGNLANVNTDPPDYLRIPMFDVTDVGYTTITVTFDSYTPINVETDMYDLEFKVSDTNKKSYDNITASDIGDIEYTFTNLLPGNTYTVSLFTFSNYNNPDAVNSQDLPSNVDNNQTLVFIEPIVSLSNVETTLVNDQGHLSVALNDFSYSEINYTVRFNFTTSAGFSTYITLHQGTSFNSFEGLEFAPELFDIPLDVYNDYTLSIQYFYKGQQIIDPVGNVIEYEFPETMAKRAFTAPQAIGVLQANIESIELSLEFTHVSELENDLYRANIRVVTLSGEQSDIYTPFVGDSGNLRYQFDNLVPNYSYEFTLVQFNHMRDESSVSAIIFSGLGANITENTLTDNVNIYYENIETDLLNSYGHVAYVRFTNFMFSTDAQTKKYNLRITLNNLESRIVQNESRIVHTDIDEHTPGALLITVDQLDSALDYFKNIAATFSVFNSTDSIDISSTNTATIASILGTDRFFPAPTHLRLEANTAESLTVYLDGFTPHPNISDNFTGSFLIYNDRTSDDFTLEYGKWDRKFPLGNLAPSTKYTIHLNSWSHEGTNIVFEAPTANAAFDTLSDNLSITFDIANVSRNMINSNAEVDRLTLPNFVFNTLSPEKEYNMIVRLTNTITRDTGWIRIPGPGPLVIDTLGMSVLYFDNYTFEIDVFNVTDQIESRNIKNGTFTGMPVLPLPDIYVTNTDQDSLRITVKYTGSNEDIIENVFGTLTNNSSLYSGDVEFTIVGGSKYVGSLLNSSSTEFTFGDYLKRSANTKFRFSGLKPEENYDLKLINFKYLSESGVESAIRFDTVSAIAVRGTTLRDTSFINPIFIIHTRIMDSLSLTDIELSNINFTAYTISTNYSLQLNFHANTTGTRAGPVAYSSLEFPFYTHDPTPVYNTTLFFNNTPLNYHWNYDVVVNYIGSTQHEHQSEFTLQGSAPWVLEYQPLTEVGNSLNSITFALGSVQGFDSIQNLLGGILVTAFSFTALFRYSGAGRSNIPFDRSNVSISELVNFKQFTTPRELMSNQDYIIEFIGVTYQPLAFKDRLQMIIQEPYPRIAGSTLGDAVHFNVNGGVSRTLVDEAGHANVTFADVEFQGTPTYHYDLKIKFTSIVVGESLEITSLNIHAHTRGTSLSVTDIGLYYFRTYQITFNYFNKTTGELIDSNHYGGSLTGTGLPIPVGFGTLSANDTTITVPMTFRDISIPVRNSYSFDIVAGDMTFQIRNKSSDYITTTNAVINGLTPSTTYIVTIDDFRHSSGTLVFEGPPIQTITTDASIIVSASYSSITTSYSSISSVHGLVGDVTFNDFIFNREGTDAAYQLKVTFNGNGNSQVFYVDIPPERVNPGGIPGLLTIPYTVFEDHATFLGYFYTYTVNFGYFNTVLGITSLYIDVSPDVPAGDPIQEPTLVPRSANSEQIVVKLDTIDTKIPVGLLDKFHANLVISYVDTGTSVNSYVTRTGNLANIGEDMSFTGLYANTAHTFELYEFVHYTNQKNTTIPIVKVPENKITRSTTSANIRSEFDLNNVSTTLLDDQGNVGNIVLPDFTFKKDDSREYNLRITFINNVTQVTQANIFNISAHVDRSPLTIIQGTHYPGYLNYFTSYVMNFEYYNVTDSKREDHYTRLAIGNVPGNHALTVPISFSKANVNTGPTGIVLSRFDFELPSDLNGINLPDVYSANIAAVPVGSPSRSTLLIEYKNQTQGFFTDLRDIEFIGLESGTDYMLEILTFDVPSVNLVWDIPNLSKSDVQTIGSINVTLNPIIGRTILNDNADMNTLIFNGFNLTGVTGLMDLHVYFLDSLDQPVKSINIDVVLPFTSTDLTLTGISDLNYFTDYFIYFKYKLGGVFVQKSGGGDLESATYPSLGVEFSKPNINILNITSETADVLLDFIHNINLTDRYTANVSYNRPAQSPEYITTWSAHSTRIENLHPNQTYDLTLVEFKHENERVQFNDTVTITDQFKTLSDNVTFSNITSTTKTLSDHLGLVYPLTIPAFKFDRVGNKRYDLLIKFTSVPETQEVLVVMSNIQDTHLTRGDLTITESMFETSGYYLNYFKNYSINITVKNITNNVFVLRDNNILSLNFDNVVPANLAITYPSIVQIPVHSNTDTIMIALSNYPSLQNVANNYYANVGITNEIQTVYKKPNGNVSSMTFDSLIPNMRYTFTLYEFRANHSLQRLIFEVPGSFPTLVANTTSDNVTFSPISTTKILSDHRGFVYPLTIDNFTFIHSGHKRYDLIITFTQDSKNTANIWDTSSAQLNDRLANVTVLDIQATYSETSRDLTIDGDLFDGSDFYLDYFQSYDITITVWNATDSVPVITEVGGSSVVKIGVVERSPDVPYPSLYVSNRTSEIITIGLLNYPDLLPTINYYANIGYGITGTPGQSLEHQGNVSSMTFSSLIPSTRYTFILYEFRADYEAQRIILPSIRTPLPTLDRDTLSDNVRTLSGTLGTIQKTLLDHRGFVWELKIPAFTFRYDGTKRYNLIITFTGGTVFSTQNTSAPPTVNPVLVVVSNIQETHSPKILTITQEMFEDSTYYLGYFQKYNINLLVKNDTNNLYVPINGNNPSLDFIDAVPANLAIKYPSINNSYTSVTDSITISLSDYPDLVSSTTINYYANVGYKLVGATEEAYRTPNGNVSSMTFDSLIPNMRYTFTLYEFRANHSAQRLMFEQAPSTPPKLDADTKSDMVSLSTSATLTTRNTLSDHRGFVYELAINEFVFDYEGTNKSYNLIITFTQDSKNTANIWDTSTGSWQDRLANVIVSNIQATRSRIITEAMFNGSGFYLDYFQQYNMMITVMNTTDSVTVITGVGGVAVVKTGVVETSPAITYPSFNSFYTKTTDNITITLSNYPELQPTTIIDYYANVGYKTTTETLYRYKTPPAGNVSSIAFDSLIPNTKYNFILYEFRANHPSQRLRFEIPGSFPTFEANTASDNVSSSGGYPLTRTLKNDNAHTNTITIPSFTFSRTGSKNYAANVTVYQGFSVTGSSVASFDIPGMNGFTGNIPNNPALDALNFFTGYTLRFAYFNLTDSVPVYTNNTQLERKHNDYILVAQSGLICPVSFGTFTRNTTSIVLSGLDFDSKYFLIANSVTVDSRLDGVIVNDNYTFNLEAFRSQGSIVDTIVPFTNVNIDTIETTANITFSSLEPNTGYQIRLRGFVQTPLIDSSGNRLQYEPLWFPTSISLSTGKFSAPTINDPASRTSNIIHVGFTPPADDELPGYLTRKSLDKQFEAKFSVASTEHNQSDIIKYLDYSDVVTGTSTVPIDGLLPNTLYTITLTGFGYETLNTIPYITFVQSSVNTLYTSTDNMVLTYDSVTHNIVDDDGDVALTFTNIRATYDTSYTYNAYIFINGTTQIGTISDIGSSTTSFTTVSDPAIPYYDSGANPPLTIKFRNMSFTNNPYVKENHTSALLKVVDDTQLLNTGGVTIIITVETIVLNANENIVITMSSTGHTLLPDVGTFKPNDLYWFKYTVNYV